MSNASVAVYKGGEVTLRYHFMQQRLGDLRVDHNEARLGFSYTPTTRPQFEGEVPYHIFTQGRASAHKEKRGAAEIFSRFIPRVIHAAGQEGSRYALNGAKLEISNERIRMVAIDGHRLALVEHEGSFSGGLDVILPKRAVIELGKLCARSDEMLRIGKADYHIQFRLGRRRIVSRLLTGIYPDYSAVLPKENFNRSTVGRAMITPAIKRVSLMAEDRSRAINATCAGSFRNRRAHSVWRGNVGVVRPWL